MSKKKKLKLTGDWITEIWFPIKAIKKLFGWFKVGDWNHFAISHDAQAKTVTVYLNGSKLVSGRKKMSLDEFVEIIKKGQGK